MGRRIRGDISLHSVAAVCGWDQTATNVDLKNMLEAASNALATSLQLPFIICPRFCNLPKTQFFFFFFSRHPFQDLFFFFFYTIDVLVYPLAHCFLLSLLEKRNATKKP